MGRKSLAYIVLIVAMVFLVSGCSSVPKKFREEVSGIRNKVDTLESRVDTVESRQVESERAVSQQIQTLEEMKTVRDSSVATTNIVTRTSKSVKSQARVKEIQVCLRNAGFYQGNIDGIKGRGTKKAIKEFQKANGLKTDGIVGAKTWEALSRYAAAPADTAAPAEEGAAK